MNLKGVEVEILESGLVLRGVKDIEKVLDMLEGFECYEIEEEGKKNIMIERCFGDSYFEFCDLVDFLCERCMEIEEDDRIEIEIRRIDLVIKWFISKMKLDWNVKIDNNKLVIYR